MLPTTPPLPLLTLAFFLKDFIYLFLERGEGREKERERNTNVREKHQWVASHRRRDWDLAHDPRMHPDWESNQRPFPVTFQFAG